MRLLMRYERFRATGAMLAPRASTGHRCQSSVRATPGKPQWQREIRAGFIGLGAMGYPMAGHVAHVINQGKHPRPLLVWNRTRAKAEQHASEFGSLAAAQLEDLASCDLVLSCLPSSPEVEEVLYRIKAARGSQADPMVWVDSTSGDPVKTKELASIAAEHGISLVDSPVSGGPRGATAGSVCTMFGGGDAEFETALPALSSFAKSVERCGPVGAGMAVKCVNNALNCAHLLIGAEGVLALKGLGVEPATALAVINKSSGRSLQTEVRLPEEVLTRRFGYGFKLGLMKKDTQTAASVLTAGFPDAKWLPSFCAAVAEATASQGEDADYTEMVRWVEGRAGMTLGEDA